MKITALIPAYNEGKTIASIISILKQIPRINEIVVVDDGSTDNTYQEAEKSGARVIKPNLTHIMKEEKRGFTQGFQDRSKMYWDILRTLFKNRLKIQ